MGSCREWSSRWRSLWGTRSARALTLARLAGLAAVLWGTANQLQAPRPRSGLGGAGPHGPGGRRLAGLDGQPPLRRPSRGDLGLPGPAVGGRRLPGRLQPFRRRLRRHCCAWAPPSLLQPSRPSPSGRPGSPRWSYRCLALGGPVPGEVIAEGAFSAVAALMIGASRRQYLARTYQAEQLLAERVRADAERDRAAALAERNRLGREIHDVLAHSLGALSVQLEAAHAVLGTSEDRDKARRLVEKARRLAVEGLEETRRAVHALRDEPVDLAEQVAALAAREGAGLTVVGQPRALGTDAGLAVYRAAQEALTNARKHAPGAEVSVRLDFTPETTVLVVDNGATTDVAASELAGTGGGFGLQGMRERVELVGGRVRAEPTTSGWTVEIAVPA